MAAMSDKPELPHSVWQGSFKLLGVDVKCHVLSDGQRIIEADSFAALLDAMGKPGAKVDEGEMEAFARWRAGQ